MSALNTTFTYFGNPGNDLPFNRDFSGGRKIAHTEIPLAEVREIRRRLGGTLNDVMLAVLGEALSRYAVAHGQPTSGATARVMTPVNVRSDKERGALGNRISMLIVEVPLDSADPVERLHTITGRTKELKEGHVADGVAVIGQVLASLLPVPALITTASTITMGNGLGNIVCTNVPGPMIPLYTVGHRMLAHYPIMPIAWNMGIGCAVMSYDKQMFVTLVADTAAAPDVALLAQLLGQAYADLRTTAGVPPAEELGEAPAAGEGATILAA